MRSRSAARSAPAAVPVSSGYIHLVSGPAASARTTTAMPTTTTISPSRLPARRYARSFSPSVSSAVKHGHERGADGGVGEELLDQLRDHRDRDERVVRGIDAVDGGGDDLAAQTGEAGDGGRGGDDDRREGELARVVAHESSDSTAGPVLLPGGRGQTASRGRQRVYQRAAPPHGPAARTLVRAAAGALPATARSRSMERTADRGRAPRRRMSHAGVLGNGYPSGTHFRQETGLPSASGYPAGPRIQSGRTPSPCRRARPRLRGPYGW